MGITELNVGYFEAGDWLHTYYNGIQILKYPNDLFTYEQIIKDTKPDIVIETGTLKGASAVWFADHGVQVITVDIESQVENPDPRVTYIISNSADRSIIDIFEDDIKGKRVMVVLDSDHNKEHVVKELEIYAPLVSSGCYLVVEDTFIGKYMQNKDYPSGSAYDALQEFDKSNFGVHNFFNVTMNPDAWLLKQ
jgi:cephalosporin hydroxylase